MDIRIVATLTFALSSVVALASAAAVSAETPLKEAKLNIEHNATDGDTGFQGFMDADGWKQLTVAGPGGEVLRFEGRGKVGRLGLAELFFETVEPAADDVPMEDLLKSMPAGKYRFSGTAMEMGEGGGKIVGTALLTHDIPAGAVLLSPRGEETVPTEGLEVRWEPVTKTIKGGPVKIIAYQLIIEKAEEPDPHMIGKRGLSMYLPASVTEIVVPKGFLEPATPYTWEVLAIEESGNQTISASGFKTK